ncbi:NAD(P)-dependent oxidoreductase [Egicoccus sp. AB-alg6-2]|uniref:NAD(P)-dependent oxidoreductase n=1 Tax=Egicoccus sp. AB-alg6-2 TaxID=3242692 RepID=UPI00359E0058
MNLTLLGATGRTGVPLVPDALARGHRLTCLVRDEGKAARLLPSDDRLRLVVGDATDASAVDAAIAGADAVLDASGPVRGGPKRLRAEVVSHVLPAMHRHGVRRLVFLTGAGVRLDGDVPGVADRAIRGLMSLVQRDILDDGQAAVAAITASDLDWTVVRVPRLVDAGGRGRVRTGGRVGDGSGTTLGRRDLARFLLDELEQGTWIRQAPVVSW